MIKISKNWVKRRYKVQGERNPSAKLKEINILEIRNLYKQGLSHNKIACRFNVSRTTVSKILNNKSWKHV